MNYIVASYELYYVEYFVRNYQVNLFLISTFYKYIILYKYNFIYFAKEFIIYNPKRFINFWLPKPHITNLNI